MKRRLSSGILVLILTLSLFANIAVAAPGSSNDYVAALNAVEHVNDYIAREVAKAQSAADTIIERCDDADMAEILIDGIIEDLINETNARVAKTIEFCAKHGVVVQCELQTYIIGEQPVEIDPLFILSD